LADPRPGGAKQLVNGLKKREQFRPFAPAILEEQASRYFEMPVPTSPYMQFVARCRDTSAYPAIVHVDGTSRVQTVNHDHHPGLHALLGAWLERTGCPMLLNTSLNVKGQPLVNTRVHARDFSLRYGVTVL
jgi:carbamoyltransferase